MKISSSILLALFILLVSSLFASNILLKNQLMHIDKTDFYWNYNKISSKPFKHLTIEGGNETHIYFQQNNTCSVKVYDIWEGYEKDSTVKVFVKNDTLHLKFDYKASNLNDKYFLSNNVLLRISAPELLSVNGLNTNLEMFDIRQKKLNISMSGKSQLQMQTSISIIDSLNIMQKDSSDILFEKNPYLKGSPTFSVKYLQANVTGVSKLDISHINPESLRLLIGDSSAVYLSGRGLTGVARNTIK
ncbi:uncharacterized protein YkuJ [Pedobacter sp. UYP24]